MSRQHAYRPTAFPAGRFRSPVSFRATEATTTTNIAARCMKPAFLPKSRDVASLASVGWVRHAGSSSEPSRGFITSDGYASASHVLLLSTKPS